MILSEIKSIIDDPYDDGIRLNAIVDEFRRGRCVSEIIEVLDAADAELVSLGVWILSELDFSLYDSEEFVGRLRRLLDSEDSAVRFNALGALFPFFLSAKQDSSALIKKMMMDSNKGVRICAERIFQAIGGT